MTSVFHSGSSGEPRRVPTPDWQLDGFRHRAYQDGDWSTFHAVLSAQAAREDARRARRRARFELFARLPVQVLVGAGVAGLFLVGFAAFWLFTHPLALALLLGVLLAGAVVWARSWLRSRRGPVVYPLAPHPVTVSTVPGSTLDMPLPATARALVDGLATTRRRHYLDALTRGLVAPPEITAAPHGRIVRAELPGGQIAPGDIDLERMAQTLGLHADQVQRVPEAPAGVLAVELLDARPRDLDPGDWPHLGQGCDWAAPITVGTDDHARPVALDLAGRRLLVVGQSGSGKTRFMRMCALYALADPRVTVSMIDLKGSPANRATMARADWAHVGQPDARLRAHLEALRQDVRDLYRRGWAGENVVAASGWRVLWIDEVQMLWSASWAEEIVEEIARTGREAGVGVVVGSQLADSKSLPTGVLTQFDLRLLLRAPEPWMQHMVIAQTVDSGALPAGHGHLWDNGDVARIVTHHVTDTQADAHLTALVAPAELPAAPASLAPLRLVTGSADDEPGDLLARVRATLGDRSGIPWDELTDTLGIDRDELQTALRSRYGIGSQSVRVGGGFARGVSRRALDQATGTA